MRKIFNYISVVRKDKYPKKNGLKILFELFHSFLLYKEIPHFYIHKMLYRKDSGNYLDYLSHSEWKRLIRSNYLHNKSYTDIFKNKLLFDRVFSEAKISIPTTLAYKIGNYIYNTVKQTNYFF